MPFLTRHALITVSGDRYYGIFHKDSRNKYSLFIPQLKKRVPTITNRIYSEDLAKLAECLGCDPRNILTDEFEG
jgi:hypothetical protein